MASAILATDEEWSIISSSDLEELSGNTSDANEDPGILLTSSVLGDVKSQGTFSGSVIDATDSHAKEAANLEATIVPPDNTAECEVVSQQLRNFQSITPYLQVSKKSTSLSDYTQNWSKRMKFGADKCGDCLKTKSRVMFSRVFGSHLSVMKQRAKSTSSLNYPESILLNFLLQLEQFQDFLIVWVLLLFMSVFVLLLSLPARSAKMPEPHFSQQYAKLRSIVLGPHAAGLEHLQKTAKVSETLRAKALCSKVFAVFRPQVSATITHKSRSNWFAWIRIPFQGQDTPQLRPHTYRESMETVFSQLLQVKKEVIQHWRPQLSNIQALSEHLFRSFSIHLGIVRIASKKAFCRMESIFQPVILSFENLRTLNLQLAQRYGLIGQDKFTSPFANIWTRGSKTLCCSSCASLFTKGQKGLDEIAKSSYLAMDKAVRNLCQMWGLTCSRSS